MDTFIYERVIELCKKNNITPAALERKLGFSNGSIRALKTSKPSWERINKIAEYFNVLPSSFENVEYISGGNNSRSELYLLIDRLSIPECDRALTVLSAMFPETVIEKKQA